MTHVRSTGVEKGDLFIGYDPATVHEGSDTRRKLFLKEEHRGVHMEVVGASGTGKTYLLEHFIRQDILAGRGVCVIDPGGDMYHRLVKFCHLHRVENRLKDRLILVDPQDEVWSLGLNYLAYQEFNPNASLTAHTALVLRGIAKVFGDEDLDETPRLSKWLSALIMVLSEAGLTLAEAQDFITNRQFRERILLEVRNPYLIIQWKKFGDYTERIQSEYLDSTENRLMRFIFSDRLRRIIGQQESRINFRKAMDNGAVILANLAPSDQLSSDEARFIGVMLIDKLCQAARSRTDVHELKRRRMYFFIDEFHNYLCDDIAKGLKELRKFGLSFVLSTQDILPLREKHVELYSAVQSNTTIKVAFAIQPEDADLMVRSLFPNYLADDQVKRVIERTFFRPVLTRETVYSRSHSTARSSGSGSGASDIAGLSEGLVTTPSTETEISITRASNAITGLSSFSSSGDSQGDSEGETDFPFYLLEEDKEISSIEDYTLEEKKQKLISQLVNQKDRHALVKVRGLEGDAWAIYTPDLPMTQMVLKSRFEETVRAAKARPALLSSEVDLQIEARRQNLLASAEEVEPERALPDVFGE